MSNPRQFPIMQSFRAVDCPAAIPWEMIEHHQTQALRNHQQTLERLAERGGLSPYEAVCVLENRPSLPIDKALFYNAVNVLNMKVLHWFNRPVKESASSILEKVQEYVRICGGSNDSDKATKHLDVLSATLTSVFDGYDKALAEANKTIAHWQANHNEQVAKVKALTYRTDLSISSVPPERLALVQEFEKLKAEIEKLKKLVEQVKKDG